MVLTTVVPLVLFICSSLANASCKNFTQSGESYTIPADAVQIISRGYVCATGNSNYEDPELGHSTCTKSQCPIKAYGIVNAQGKSNLSLSSDDLIPLYDLVATHWTYGDAPFPYSFSSPIDNITSCMDAAPSNSSSRDIPAGYYGFTATLRCLKGTLSQCSNGPVTDGTGIEICGVQTFGHFANGKFHAVGTVGFISTDVDNAANLTTNPAATRSPAATLPKDMAKYASSASGTVTIGSTMAFGFGIWLTLYFILETRFM